ncbi:hypothetical protein J437_LFUL004547 [Ladona fulva]|uniref:PHD-type domain-containing protein n=1 Tax=Ladona fulva TaxID=123851 RepID=A0A8K0JTQ1_LADFU|nr:hypothetical protein J437_LFUL004547 [Ladona fulva]
MVLSTAGSEGEGSAAPVSTSESTPSAAVKRKKKRKKASVDNKFTADIPRELPKKKVVVADEKQPRGPYIRVEGPRDGPRRVTVVNVGTRGIGALGEDDEGGDRSGVRARGRGRKLGVSGAKVTKDGSCKVGARAAVQSGADASQPDRSWVCVFCRHGSHYGGLGDLFGPYFIGKDPPEDEAADDFDRSDRLDSENGGDNGNKLGKGRRASGTVEKPGKKSKRRWSVTCSSPGSLDGAATPVSPNESESAERLEVWMHEECAVWAAGLYQIGSRIVGLQEAAWSSAKMACAECGLPGANVGCVRRGCGLNLHFPCARDHGWQLDEEEFLASCPSHRKGSKAPGPVLPT